MKTAFGVACLLSIACAGLVVLTRSCSSGGTQSAGTPEAVRGPDTPRFARAAHLLSAARTHGVICVKERGFNPVKNVASDSIGYRVPDGRTCDLPSGERLYVIVYDNLLHRVEAVAHGEAQGNLCSYTGISSRAGDSWKTLVAGNWRVATPDSAETLASLRTALGGTAEPETLSCRFRS